MDDEINSIDFIKARAEEVQKIEQSINTNRKKTMLFQRLPFHRRRRTRSFQKKTRCPKKGGIGTWFSKRFRMIRVYGTELPLRRCMKSDSFIYKSFKRGFLFYESHKKARVFRKGPFQLEGEYYETEKYFILVSMEYSPGELELLGFLDTPIALLGDATLEQGVYTTKRDLKSELVLSTTTLDEYVEEEGDGEDIVFMFLGSPGGEGGKIFVRKGLLMRFWQKAVLKGFVPVSVEELLRIGLEKRFLVFPFDYVMSKFYAEYEHRVLEPVVQKYHRTPRAKRPGTTRSIMAFKAFPGRLFFFDVPKGTVGRCAEILCGERVVGRVSRASFCFSVGRVRGVCLVERGYEDQGLCARNVGSPRLVPIVLLPGRDD